MELGVIRLEVSEQGLDGHRCRDLCLFDKSLHIIDMERGHGRQQIGAVDGSQAITGLQTRDRDARPLQRFRAGQRARHDRRHPRGQGSDRRGGFTIGRRFGDGFYVVRITAPLPTGGQEVRRLAVDTFARVGCAGLARVDFFVEGDHVLVNELNTMPGFTQTSVYPREIVKQALARNAAAVIFAHNHPSGVAQPSQADELLTRNLRDALALVDVKVLDHFIIAGSQAISFAERGLL